MRIGAGGGSTEERIAEPIGGLHGVLTGARTDVDAPATRAWSEQLSLTDGTSCDACRWQRRERFFAAIQNPTNGETVHSRPEDYDRRQGSNAGSAMANSVSRESRTYQVALRALGQLEREAPF